MYIPIVFPTNHLTFGIHSFPISAMLSPFNNHYLAEIKFVADLPQKSSEQTHDNLPLPRVVTPQQCKDGR